MRLMAIGGLVGAALIAAMIGSIDTVQAWAEPGTAEQLKASGEFFAFTVPAGENRQHVVLVDPKVRSLAVYDVDPQSGAITVKSVRNFEWDLRMVELNGTKPLPREIRAALEHR